MLPPELQTLVNNFHDQIESYKSPSYNETQLRRDFLDKFIKILGWDVDNEKVYAESFREVIHEDRIRIAGQSKAPDYCIQSNGGRLFYIEAKKPSINIHHDSAPAFQIRRYGWTAKMPVCLLTDFYEFSVYDTGVKPQNTDDAATARIFYCRYDELDAHNPKYPENPTNWDFLYNLFSKEAVYKGSLEKFRTSTKKKGTQEVDEAFLEDIEHWRKLLADNICLRNELSERELNYVIQKTIDRIIFLRICEDRGIESANILKTISDGKEIYKHLLNLFIVADEKYNSGLFHFHTESGIDEPPDTISESLAIDDKVLREIIRGIYYPAPYEFAVLPADILGSIYERFLGKIIRMASARRAKVEEKPEVRKAGGVYYTPQYIVKYIVENTIGVQLQNKTPKTLKNFRVLDPACGSGSFLINAYQYLLDWYLAEYVQLPASHKKQLLKIGDTAVRGVVYKLTIQERKRILTDHIFGVDIDTQAVEVTKLSLLLKALEGLTEQEIQKNLFNERVLPDLSRNIKCGNSLISNDFYAQGTLDLSEDEQYKINAFDWETEFAPVFKDGGFDVVIGNPPYVTYALGKGQKEKQEAATLDYLKINYIYSAKYKLNSFAMFYEKMCMLLSANGIGAFIVPATLLINETFKDLRGYIIKQNILSFYHKLNYKVWKSAETGDTCIVCLQKNLKNNFIHSLISNDDFDFSKTITSKILNNDILNQSEYRFLSNSFDYKLLKTSNSTLTDVCKLYNGIKTGDNKRFLSDSKLSDKYKPVITGRDFNKFIVPISTQFVLFDTKKLWSNFNETILAVKNKILIRQTSDRIIATLDEVGLYPMDTVHMIYTSELNMKYLLGIINSKLFNYLHRSIVPEKGKAFAEVKIANLKQVPIPVIDLQKESNKRKHDKLVAFVEQMLALKQKEQAETLPQTKTMIGRQIQAVDRQIDALVYGLYNLTEDEINVVDR